MLLLQNVQGPVIPAPRLNIIRFLHGTSQGSTNLTRKSHLAYFLGCAFIAENLEMLDASEIRARRFNAKEVITLEGSAHFSSSQSQMVQQNCREETTKFENPLVRSEDLSGEVQGKPEGFKLTETKDDA